MRRQLAKGVRMYTGDDFNYAELIAGDDKGYSDALLGIFDAIAPAASAALAALAAGDRARFDDILAPTVPLSRHIFKAPTRFYKTGVVFMAYLNGLQDHFVMVGGQQSARSIVAPGRAVPPRRPRRPAARSGHGAAPHGARAGRARDRLMRDLAGDLRHLSINTATVRKQLALPAIIEACVARGIGAVCPWRDQVHAAGLAAVARQIEGRRPRRLRLLPRRLLPGRRCRRPARGAGGQPQGRRRGQGARCRLPGAGGGRAARRAGRQARLQGHRPGPRPGARRHRRHPGVRQERRHAARHRAAASHAGRRARLHQHAGACARHLRCARPRPHRRARRRARRLPLLVGPQAREPDRPRGRASACSPTTSATGWCRRATSSTTAA